MLTRRFWRTTLVILSLSIGWRIRRASLSVKPGLGSLTGEIWDNITPMRFFLGSSLLIKNGVVLLVRLLWTVARLLGGAHPLQTGKSGWGRKPSGRAPVRVRRDWDDHRIGTVRWSDLGKPRWDMVSGGTQTRAPQPFVHGYVMCDKVKGDIAHSCIHGPSPHNIKVCIVQKDNSRQVWDYLMKIVGSRPPRSHFDDR